MSVFTGTLQGLNAALVVQTDVTTLPSPGSVGFDISGNFTGTLTFEATINGTNWFPVNATPVTAAGGVIQSTTQASGQFAVSVTGFSAVRVRFSAYAAGSATVGADISNAPVSPFNQTLSVVTVGDNQGGPPLASGLPSTNVPDDVDKNFQGSDNVQTNLVPTVAGATTITFVDNPWLQGLSLGAAVLLSASPNSGPAEEVIVSNGNIPSATPGATTITLVNPVVFAGSAFAVWDIFGVPGPSIVGINSTGTGATIPGQTVVGTKAAIQLLFNPYPKDIKRPLNPWLSYPGAPGVAQVLAGLDPAGSGDFSQIRQLLEKLLVQAVITNRILAQMKDGGPMELPLGFTEGDLNVQ